MSKFYNNRERSDRYQGNRSYIHQPGSVEWWRGACALAAIVVSAWFVWHFGFSPEARSNGFHSSRGELTYKHSAWNDRCDACHVPTEKISAEHQGLFDINGRWTEFSCRHCHSGPPHHTYAKSEDLEFDKNCAACHHDHSGKEYSLVRIADSHCTRCHSELDKHPNKYTDNKNYQANITNFGTEGGHPQFSALDPKKSPVDRSIKFSHTLHMAPGIFVNQNPNSAEDVWSVKYIEKIDAEKLAAKGNAGSATSPFSYADRYRQFETTGSLKDAKGNPISYTQLTCMACHELDSGRRSRFPPKESKEKEAELTEKKPRDLTGWNGTDKIVPEAPRESLLPPRSEGAYYLPINFEKHCQGCHPIAVNLNTRDGHTVKFDLPHRKQLTDFDDTLFDRIVRVYRTELGAKEGSPKLPNRLDKPIFPLTEKEAAEVNEDREKAKDKLAEKMKPLNQEIEELAARGVLAIQTSGTTCQKCHVVTRDEQTKQLKVKPGNTPAVWFEHSKFSHVGHRAMNCAECHVAYASAIGPKSPYENGALKWIDPEEWNTPNRPDKVPPAVDIVGVDECRKCHAPLTGTGATQKGGVRHDCTDCHRYHNAEFPLQGMGAINRDPGYEPDPNKIDDGLNPSKDRRRDPDDPLRLEPVAQGPPTRPTEEIVFALFGIRSSQSGLQLDGCFRATLELF